MKSLRIYSFFSGAGFLDLGFEKEGFSIDYVNEFNPSFLNVYKYARKNMKIKKPKYGYYCGDINNLEDERTLYDQIKKYKQASSEGTRKQINRMARFDVLKTFLLKENYSNDLINRLKSKLIH